MRVVPKTTEQLQRKPSEIILTDLHADVRNEVGTLLTPHFEEGVGSAVLHFGRKQFAEEVLLLSPAGS